MTINLILFASVKITIFVNCFRFKKVKKNNVLKVFGGGYFLFVGAGVNFFCEWGGLSPFDQ